MFFAISLKENEEIEYNNVEIYDEYDEYEEYAEYDEYEEYYQNLRIPEPVKIEFEYKEITQEELDKQADEIQKNKEEAKEKVDTVKAEAEKQKEIALKNAKKFEQKNMLTANRGTYLSKGVKLSVPSNSDMKSYMDYRAIKSKSSKQYKLQQLPEVYTDENGYRRLGEHYMIALGTYYSPSAGYIFKIKLDTGREFTAVTGDIKADKDTDETRRQHKKDKSVVEFIVSQDKIHPLAKNGGSMSKCPNSNMKGNVVKIEKIGKIDIE